MSHEVHSPTLTKLLDDVMDYHLSQKKPDAVLSIETHLFDVSLIADRCELTFDVGHQLHLNVGRFSRLVKEYISLEKVEHFINSCKEIVAGNARDGACAGFLFRDPVRTAKKHRWGGCLQSLNFKATPHGPAPFQITVNSRTTYIGYMGHLDACLIYTIISYITDPANVTMRWQISSMQLHAFKSLPLILRTPRLEKQLMNLIQATDLKVIKNLEGPTWYYLANWFQRLLRDFKEHGVEMTEVEKYGPFKRVKRRWLEHTGRLSVNLPPTLLVQDLTLDKASCEADDGVDDDADDED